MITMVLMVMMMIIMVMVSTFDYDADADDDEFCLLKQCFDGKDTHDVLRTYAGVRLHLYL